MGTRWLEDKLGLTVKWSMFGGGPAIVDALSRDEVDIGYPVMIGIDKGVPIICVGGGHMEGTVMIGPHGCSTLDDMGGDTASVLEQFSGGVIGCPPSGSIHDVIIRNLLEKHDLGGSIEVRNFPWADFIPDALADGQVDAAIGTPPLSVAAARVCHAKVIIPPSKLWPFNPSYGIIVSKELLRDRRGSELVEVVDSDFILQTYQVSPRYCAGLPREYIDSTMAFVPVLRNLGYVKNELDESDVFDRTLIEKVHPGEHHYFS